MATRTERLTDILIVGMLMTALAVGGTRAYQFYDAWVNDPSRTKEISNWESYGSTGRRLGPSPAAVTIVEFADFQCPFCRRADSTLKRLRSARAGDIAVVYRHYPIHEFAFAAAQAVECAGAQGAFEPMHDVLYQRAESIGVIPWTRFAAQAGVQDTVVFARCLSDATVTRRIVDDTVAAHALGVSGTPTFLINDLRVVGYSGAMGLDSVVTRAFHDAKRNYVGR
jgi:protein-disulfide isomerase